MIILIVCDDLGRNYTLTGKQIIAVSLQLINFIIYAIIGYIKHIII